MIYYYMIKMIIINVRVLIYRYRGPMLMLHDHYVIHAYTVHYIA